MLSIFLTIKRIFIISNDMGRGSVQMHADNDRKQKW